MYFLSVLEAGSLRSRSQHAIRFWWDLTSWLTVPLYGRETHFSLFLFFQCHQFYRIRTGPLRPPLIFITSYKPYLYIRSLLGVRMSTYELGGGAGRGRQNSVHSSCQVSIRDGPSVNLFSLCDNYRVTVISHVINVSNWLCNWTPQ